jgi:Ca-activated chloride channel homolog
MSLPACRRSPLKSSRLGAFGALVAILLVCTPLGAIAAPEPLETSASQSIGQSTGESTVQTTGQSTSQNTGKNTATNTDQEGRFQFRSAIDAVNLSLVVTDKKGRFIPGLEAGDFVVTENQTPQEIAFFTSEVTPVTLLLLLDASTSVRESVDSIKEAAANFVTKLWDGDKAIIADFNERVRFSSHFSGDIDRLIATIQSLYPAGWTALYDSILLSLEKVSEADGRKALLVFTDGDDSRSMGQGSEASAKDAIEGAKFTEVTIYSIGFEGRRGAGAQGVNKGFLKKISEETGGASFFPKGIGDLNESFEQVQNELHSQYRLAYVPSNQERNGEWRSIEVRVKNRDDLIVRTRRGYYAVPEHPSM